MFTTLINRDEHKITLRGDKSQTDILNDARNAVYAENVSLEMDNEEPFLENISSCLFSEHGVSLEIKCLNESAINKVLDILTNEFGAHFSEAAYGKESLENFNQLREASPIKAWQAQANPILNAPQFKNLTASKKNIPEDIGKKIIALVSTIIDTNNPEKLNIFLSMLEKITEDFQKIQEADMKKK
jgi:hypothetical protein